MTKISARRYVDCPFSAAIEIAEKAAGRRSEFYVTPSPPLGERVRLTATTTPDTTDDARKHDALLIAWRPHTNALFPHFQGVLTVRPRQRGVLLRLDGRYEPPYGVAGKMFDYIAGRPIAKRTLDRFLNDIAADIEAEYAREKSAYKTA